MEIVSLKNSLTKKTKEIDQASDQSIIRSREIESEYKEQIVSLKKKNQEIEDATDQKVQRSRQLE